MLLAMELCTWDEYIVVFDVQSGLYHADRDGGVVRESARDLVRKTAKFLEEELYIEAIERPVVPPPI